MQLALILDPVHHLTDIPGSQPIMCQALGWVFESMLAPEATPLEFKPDFDIY